jgi:hypothetical protein
MSTHDSGPTLTERDKQLRKFYGSLTLLEFLNPIYNNNDYLSSLSSDSRHEKNDWQRFLDNLSLLADHEGPKTISSIAVQKLPDGNPKYWMVSHSDREEMAASYIKWVLQKLEDTDSVSNSKIEELRTAISEESVKFGEEKLKQYQRWLLNLLGKLRETLSSRADPLAKEGRFV